MRQSGSSRAVPRPRRLRAASSSRPDSDDRGHPPAEGRDKSRRNGEPDEGSHQHVGGQAGQGQPVEHQSHRQRQSQLHRCRRQKQVPAEAQRARGRARETQGRPHRHAEHLMQGFGGQAQLEPRGHRLSVQAWFGPPAVDERRQCGYCQEGKLKAGFEQLVGVHGEKGQRHYRDRVQQWHLAVDRALAAANTVKPAAARSTGAFAPGHECIQPCNERRNHGQRAPANAGKAPPQQKQGTHQRDMAAGNHQHMVGACAAEVLDPRPADAALVPQQQPAHHRRAERIIFIGLLDPGQRRDAPAFQDPPPGRAAAGAGRRSGGLPAAGEPFQKMPRRAIHPVASNAPGFRYPRSLRSLSSTAARSP